MFVGKIEVITGDTHMEVANTVNEMIEEAMKDRRLLQPVGPVAFYCDFENETEFWYCTLAHMAMPQQSALALPGRQ